MVQMKRGTSRELRRAVIFDFDGTIADSVVAFARVFGELMHLPEPLTLERMEELKGLSGKQFMREYKIPKWKALYLVVQGRRMLHDHMADTQLIDGIAGVIKSLHAAGIPLYIVSSNSNELIEHYLKQHQLSSYFADVSGGASPFAKARKLLRLMSKHGIDPEQSWYVGDETRDVSAAKAAGLHIVSVSWGFNVRAALEVKQPDLVVDTPPQLLKALKAAWKK